MANYEKNALMLARSCTTGAGGKDATALDGALADVYKNVEGML